MSLFTIQEQLARDLLKKKENVVCIHKTTRSGCTLSLIKVCYETRRSVVIFSPTIRILKQVQEVIPKITHSRPRIAPILSNPELCAELTPNPKLKFQFKKNCSTCEYEEKPKQCVFQDLLMNKFDIYCLTYSKLQALQKSTSEEAKQLLQKIQKCDVFIFDEFTTAVIRDMPTVDIITQGENGEVVRMSEHIKTTFAEEFRRTDNIISEDLYDKNRAFLKESVFWGIVIDTFLAQFSKINQSGIYKNFVADFFSKGEMNSMFQYGWNKITELTMEGRDTTELQQIFLAAFVEEIIVTNENGTVKLTQRMADALGYLRYFCQTLSDRKHIFAVDSYQPSVNLDKVFQRPVEHLLWGADGDPSSTNRQQLILCDTAHWGSVNFCRDLTLQSSACAFTKRLLEVFPPSKIIIVTTNKKMTRIISMWKLPKEVKLTWHRSDWMRGVSVEDRRIMICLGGSYLPRTAYVSEAHSFDFKVFARNLGNLSDGQKVLHISKTLKVDDTRSEFVNTIGRVKDPTARERSLVITLGMNILDIQTLLTQTVGPSISKPHLIKPIRKGGLLRDGLWISKLWLIRHLPIDVKDLPLLARIIRCTKNKIKVRASEIIPGMTEAVISTAKHYRDVLEWHNVKFMEKRGGTTFYVNNLTLDHFSTGQND